MDDEKKNLPEEFEEFQEGYTWKSMIVPTIALIVSIITLVCALRGTCNC